MGIRAVVDLFYLSNCTPIQQEQYVRAVKERMARQLWDAVENTLDTNTTYLVRIRKDDRQVSEHNRVLDHELFYRELTPEEAQLLK